METTAEAFTHYRDAFPSKAFLTEFVGPDESFMHLIGPGTTVHTEVRRLIDGALRTMPRHHLKRLIGLGAEKPIVYVFQEGQCGPLVEQTLVSYGLSSLIEPHASARLCSEFLEHYHRDAFQGIERSWCRFASSGQSLWLEQTGPLPKRILSSLLTRLSR
jgi:hypothetical protein